MKLLWLDMEMTGLEPERDVPLEVAAVVSVPREEQPFAPLAELALVVRQPQSVLDAMDAWCKETHGKSGLSAKVLVGTPLAEADAALAGFIKLHFGKDKPVLAGNSIGQDRRFLRRYFPVSEALLHYRMLDVSSWKVVFEGLYGKKYRKQNKHTAIEDIRESMAELSHYLAFVKAAP